ncbi:hypothetical protein E2C01_037503 [Portunus trituberculatus]|uniref:Uncharacterized protein n=1 Tax=Portunus trituberculatus TaxID=210409 RepID=A0A5B7FFT6_PORTR|nr:hypothetical protein [Portunus trituberculatus]
MIRRGSLHAVPRSLNLEVNISTYKKLRQFTLAWVEAGPPAQARLRAALATPQQVVPETLCSRGTQAVLTPTPPRVPFTCQPPITAPTPTQSSACLPLAAVHAAWECTSCLMPASLGFLPPGARQTAVLQRVFLGVVLALFLLANLCHAGLINKSISLIVTEQQHFSRHDNTLASGWLLALIGRDFTARSAERKAARLIQHCPEQNLGQCFTTISEVPMRQAGVWAVSDGRRGTQAWRRAGLHDGEGKWEGAAGAAF